MKKYFRKAGLLLMILLLVSACRNNTDIASKEEMEEFLPPAAPKAVIEGTVVETMNAATYTYAELKQGDEKFWITGPSVNLNVGDKVIASGVSLMTNFRSKTLDRTFDKIYFVMAFNINGVDQPTGFAGQKDGTASGDGKKPAGHSSSSSATAAGVTLPEKGSIARVKGGYTLEELFAKKNEMGGKQVSVRAKVVKASGRIMGKNWFHLQDGTGAESNLDLVMTSNEDASIGDIIVASGKLTLDKDIGAGYKYDILLEEAKITVE